MPKHVEDLLKKESNAEDPFDPLKVVDAMNKAAPSSGKRRKEGVMNTEIYVRGIPWTMDRKGLRLLFAKYNALYARILMNARNNSRSLGYGFVGFKTTSKANAAIRAMDGIEVEGTDGRKTVLHLAFASANKTIHREMSTKAGKREFKEMIAERKKILTARDSEKVVMSAENMPRRWKVVSDKVTYHDC
jgi:RNA recognition motif-containing protein